MNIRDLLYTLVNFYRQVGAGHTQVMLTGVTASDRHPFVVLANSTMGRQSLDPRKCRPITLQEIGQGRLHGAAGPMAWEHTALQEVFRVALSRITELEADAKFNDNMIKNMVRDQQALRDRVAVQEREIQDLNALVGKMAEQGSGS